MNSVQPMIDAIETWRNQQLNNHRPLADGTMGEPGPYDSVTVADACKVSKDKRSAEHIFLTTALFAPTCAIEIGTNIGISSSYIGSAMNLSSRSWQLHTIEASPYRLQLARQLHQTLNLEGVRYHHGFFYDLLPSVLSTITASGRRVDFAFIDGQHQYQPTLDFFDMIYRASSPSSLFVFDDIEWSDGMKDAWKQIQRDRRISFSTSVYGVGYVMCG